MKKLTLVVLALVLFTSSAEAQLFKNLKKKVEKKVEQSVTDKIADKAAQEADKQLENLWKTDLSSLSLPMGTERIDPSEIPESYEFEWEYSVTIEMDEGAMDMVYLLKEEAPHFGIRVPKAEEMLIVQDNQKEMTVMYMRSGDNNMVSATRFSSDTLNTIDRESPYEEMEIRETGTKSILGYECQGYEMENEQYLVTFYVTDQAEVNLNHMYQGSPENIPRGFNPDWLREGTGLMMEMNMKDKKDPAKNVTMVCTGLEKNKLTLQTSDYQAF